MFLKVMKTIDEEVVDREIPRNTTETAHVAQIVSDQTRNLILVERQHARFCSKIARVSLVQYFADVPKLFDAYLQ